jgi:preprotein translocase subunit SecE
METENGAKRCEDCSAEEVRSFQENASKRLSENLSRFLAQHPEELKKIEWSESK